MKRLALVATMLVIGGSFAIAQQDPIQQRQALMKENGKQAQQGNKFMKGEEAFDLAKAKAIFATYQKVSHDVANLWPDNSKTGHDTAALPAVWEKKADFDARLKKLGDDAKAAEAKVTDEASFKTVFPEVQKNCGGCHEPFRKKKT